MSASAGGLAGGEPATRSYHLTGEQVRFFDENGYLILRGRVRQPLLGRLQDAAARMIDAGRAMADDDPRLADYVFAPRLTHTPGPSGDWRNGIGPRRCRTTRSSYAYHMRSRHTERPVA